MIHYSSDKTTYYEEYTISYGHTYYRARFIYDSEDTSFIDADIRNIEKHSDRFAIDITTQNQWNQDSGEYEVNVVVQTTSWGVLDTETMRKVVTNYQEAIECAEQIKQELRETGVKVAA